MRDLWWQLPGPRAYIGKVAEDIRSGKNVIICLPEHAPQGLRAAVRAELQESDGWLWHTLQVEECPDLRPIDLLFSTFCPRYKHEAVRNSEALICVEDFQGKLIWLEGLTKDNWPAWRDFLGEYEHACRSFQPLQRSQFCVPIVGDLTSRLPGEDVCLSHRPWRSCVGRVDILIYAYIQFQDRSLSELQKRVATAIVARVSSWDPSVSDRLVHETLDTILDPRPVLKTIAEGRGWTARPFESQEILWQRGMMDSLSGDEELHSSIIVLEDKDREVDRRIWAAQIEVLFPFVEERRRELLRRFGHLLQVPFTTRNGDRIEDIRDLEIG